MHPSREAQSPCRPLHLHYFQTTAEQKGTLIYSRASTGEFNVCWDRAREDLTHSEVLSAEGGAVGFWNDLPAFLVKFCFPEPAFPNHYHERTCKGRGNGENRKSDFMPLAS